MEQRKTVVIMGLGLHGGGAAAANYFTQRGDRVIVTDLKPAEDLGEGLRRIKNRDRVRFVLGRHEFRDFEEADLVIRNPGVPPDSPYILRALEKGIKIETDIGIFLDAAFYKARVIVGVTGTKGKSTTTSLIHAVLSRQGHTLIGGNITVPVLEILSQVRQDTAVVLELSSFQLGGIRDKGFSPQVAVFTNFLDDHLDYYGSREAYFEDKRVLCRHQSSGDLLVLNRDNRVFSMVSPNPEVVSASFGMEGNFEGDGSYVEGRQVMYRRGGRDEPVLERSRIAIPGRHNLYNVLAAVAAVMTMGVEVEAVREGISGFRGLPHRLEDLGSRGGIRFVNDSAATTPDAAIQALSSIQGPITLIAGGTDKGLDLDIFAEALSTRVTNLLLLQGSGTERLLQHGLTRDYTLFDNLEHAFTRGVEISTPGTTLLLSPGFASFGMFKNEFDRGERFRELVRRYVDEEAESTRDGRC